MPYSSSLVFSLLLDASADKGNVDNELILAVWCEIDNEKKVEAQREFFTVFRPMSATAEGLYETLEATLGMLHFPSLTEDDCTKLIRVGTDGASVNVARKGLKGLIEKRLPLVYWSWCLAHKVELAVKDALKSTQFDDIDEFFLRLYYLYEISAKRSREPDEIVIELKECYSFDDGGTRPV